MKQTVKLDHSKQFKDEKGFLNVPVKIGKVNKMTIKKPQAIELWRETHGHISKICSTLGISRTTFYNWMNDDKEFATALVDAEAELSDDIRDVLISKAAEGDMTAVIFYLKNRHPDFKPQPTTLIQNNFGEHARKELEEFK